MAIIKPIEEYRAQVRAKRDADLAAYAPVETPVKPEDLRGETIIEGKPVEKWATLLEELDENARALFGQKADVDLATYGVPGWALWAVQEWRKRGSPTELSVLARQIQDLTNEAERIIKFASMDDDAAMQLDAVGKKDKAEARRKQAGNKRAKAEKLWAQIKSLRDEKRSAGAPQS